MNTDDMTVGLGKRVGARVLDGLMVALIVALAQVLALLSDGVVVGVLSVVLYLAALGLALYNQVVRVGLQGQSLGRQFVGVRVVDQDTREAMGIGRAFIRELVFGLLFAACWIPGIVNIVITAKDPRRQGWHDKAVRTVVVPAPATTTGTTAGPPPAEPEPQAPSLATGATSPPPYAPAAPPVAPATPTTAPPAPVTAEHDTIGPPAATTSPTGMVAPPPGVEPPPVAPVANDEPAAATMSPDDVETDPERDGSAGDSGSREWRLTTPTGATRVVEGLLLVGRDPDPELVAGAAVWAVDDPQLTMSKTHALLGLADGTAWVEDWHSTNGVALHRGEAALVIEPHARTPLRDGDVIEFGAYKIAVEAGG